ASSSPAATNGPKRSGPRWGSSCARPVPRASGARRERLSLREALLAEGVAVHVVPRPFPVPGLVPLHADAAAHPLRALPRVEVGDHQPQRSAVVGLQVIAVVKRREEYV